MAKTLLIYDDVVQLNPVTHKDWAVDGYDRYDFAAATNSVPLTTVEFAAASLEYTIVFTRTDTHTMPVAVLGLRRDQNVFVDAEGRWDARYIPAFVRRYPFVFSADDEAEVFRLCMDERFPGLNTNGQGQRLFNEDGSNSVYLNRVIDFLREYQGHFKRTEAFCKTLEELNLLDSMNLTFKDRAGRDRALNGLLAINREKLAALSGEQLSALAKTGELEYIYLHINSVQNFKNIIAKLED